MHVSRFDGSLTVVNIVTNFIVYCFTGKRIKTQHRVTTIIMDSTEKFYKNDDAFKSFTVS